MPFRPISRYISETAQVTDIVTNTMEGNWYALYRMVLFSVTLSDQYSKQ